ncbi:hypothetical protein N9L68_00225 [bacterium]|nr:hypothetical protein [bacterium]
MSLTGRNPMRLQEVSRAFRWAEVLMLTGTALRAAKGEPVWTQQTDHHLFLHFGWTQGAMTNKSAGCSIGFKKTRFSMANIKQIDVPDTKLQGRGGAVRMKGSNYDFRAIVTYFPPRARGRKETMYMNTCNALGEWTMKVLGETPTRCTPLWSMDLNRTMGATRSPEGWLHEEDDAHVGPCARGQEDGAAVIVRRILETHLLYLPSTFKPLGPTYHGAEKGSASTIDYIALPLSLHVKKMIMMTRVAKALQLIPSARPRDHIPMYADLAYYMTTSELAPQGSWDQDKIAKAMRCHEERQKFVTALEEVSRRRVEETAGVQRTEEPLEQMRETTDEEGRTWYYREIEVDGNPIRTYLPAPAQPASGPAFQPSGEVRFEEDLPDLAWDELADDIIEAGRNAFKKGPVRDERYKKRMQERLEALKKRKEARMAHNDEESIRQHRMVKRATEECRKVRKRQAAEMQQELAEECEEAWRNGRHAEAHKIGRRLAGRGMGVKKRKYRIPPPHRAGRAAWAQAIVQPGREGGHSAVLKTIAEHTEEVQTKARLEGYATHVWDLQSDRQAKQDVVNVEQVLFGMKRRRASPPWSVPTELWLMALRPARLWARRKVPRGSRYEEEKETRTGLGYEAPKVTTHWFRRRVLKVVAHARACQRIPVRGNRSRPWIVSKNKAHIRGPRGERMLHGLCAFWRAWYTQLCQGGARPPPLKRPQWAYGSVKGRRREGALLTQSSSQWKCRRHGVSNTFTAHDLANAFASGPHAEMRVNSLRRMQWKEKDGEWVQRNTAELEPYVKQRLEEMHIQIDTISGSVEAVPREGGVMGEGEAPGMFLDSFHVPVQTWQTATRDDEAKWFQGRDPLVGRVDVSLTTFVDDIGKRRGSKKGAAHHEEVITKSNDELDKALMPRGYGQNRGKQEILITFHGPGAVRATKDLAASRAARGQVRAALRYLGPYMAANGGMRTEQQKRMEAVQRAWHCAGYLWESAVPMSFKRIIFLNDLQGAAISGLEGFALNSGFFRPLDSSLIKKMRYLRRGRAHRVRDGRHHADSDYEVLRRMRMVPCELELRVRRLKWLQAIAKEPTNNGQIIVMLMGRLDHEDELAITEAGEITNTATPWAHQMINDVEAIKETEEGELVHEAMEGNMRNLFVEGEWWEAFQGFDPAQLRAQFLAQPECSAAASFKKQREQTRSHDDEIDSSFECQQMNEDDTPCSRSFRSYQALRMHETLSHGMNNMSRKLTVTNQCMWCLQEFATRAIAQFHVEASVRMRRCAISRVRMPHAVQRPTELSCPHDECEEREPYPSLEELQRHIRSHFPEASAPAWETEVPQRAPYGLIHGPGPTSACRHRATGGSSKGRGKQGSRTRSSTPRQKSKAAGPREGPEAQEERRRWRGGWWRGANARRRGGDGNDVGHRVRGSSQGSESLGQARCSRIGMGPDVAGQSHAATSAGPARSDVGGLHHDVSPPAAPDDKADGGVWQEVRAGGEGSGIGPRPRSPSRPRVRGNAGGPDRVRREDWRADVLRAIRIQGEDQGRDERGDRRASVRLPPEEHVRPQEREGPDGLGGRGGGDPHQERGAATWRNDRAGASPSQLPGARDGETGGGAIGATGRSRKGKGKGRHIFRVL